MNETTHPSALTGFRKSKPSPLFGEKLTCQECHKTFHGLANHVKKAHGISVKEYREKYKIGEEVSLLGEGIKYKRTVPAATHEEFLRRILKGRTPAEIMRDPDMPSDTCFYNFAKRHPEFAKRVDKAREQLGLKHSRDYGTEAKELKLKTDKANTEFQDSLQTYLKERNIDDAASPLHNLAPVLKVSKLTSIEQEEDIEVRELDAEEVLAAYRSPNLTKLVTPPVEPKIHNRLGDGLEVRLVEILVDTNQVVIEVSEGDESSNFQFAEETPISKAFRDSIVDFCLAQAQAKAERYLTRH